MAKRKSIPKLSVGGRALAKHSTRSSQVYIYYVTIYRGFGAYAKDQRLRRMN